MKLALSSPEFRRLKCKSDLTNFYFYFLKLVVFFNRGDISHISADSGKIGYRNDPKFPDRSVWEIVHTQIRLLTICHTVCIF